MRALLPTLLILWPMVLSGCSLERSSRWLANRSDHLRAKAEARDLEVAKKDAARKIKIDELRYETARARADAESTRDALSNQLEDQVRSTLQLNLDQSVQVGQLQVNIDELERLVKERKETFENRKREWDDLQKKQREEALDAQIRRARDLLASGDVTGARETLMSCAAPKESCACIEQPGLARSPRQLPPIQRPVLPTEIPLMLPVSLNVQFENPEVSETRIRRIPRPIVSRKAPCVSQPCESTNSCAPPLVPAPTPESEPTDTPEEEIDTADGEDTGIVHLTILDVFSKSR